MSLIIKGDKDKQKQAQQRQVYTWAACVFVGLFLLSVAIPMLSGGKKNTASSYKESYYDLAAMPFASDAAEQELLASARYADIAKTDLINTLFSKQDKEDRQAEDAELGAPPPPDEDYAAAERQKQAAAISAGRAANRAAARTAPAAKLTSQGSLRSGSGSAGGGKASSGASGSIWRGDLAQAPKLPASTGQASAAALAEELKKGGRASGYFNAYEKSVEAGKAKDLEAAAGGAADAFQDGEGGEGDLNTEMEQAMAELGADAVMDPSRMGSAEGMGELERKLDGAKDRAQAEMDPCPSLLSSWTCALQGIGQQMLEGLVDVGLDYLKGGGSCPRGYSSNGNGTTNSNGDTIPGSCITNPAARDKRRDEREKRRAGNS